MELNKKSFLAYKLFNSFFTGISIGILITIYEPLDPSIYSLGGMILALGMLLIAKFYDQILNIKHFYQISLIVEIVMLMTIISFLQFKYSNLSALLIYIGYQFTFIFGGYLLRAETLIAKEKKFLSKIDIFKQIGYLLGLAASFIFYKILEYNFEITDAKLQIGILHYILFTIQALILILLVSSFKK